MAIRWQDWASAILGCWLALSPWALDYWLNNAAAGNACGIGVVIVLFNVMSACRLVDKGQEIFNILLGSWLLLSPYMLNFMTDWPATANAILVGMLVVALAVWQIHDAIRR